METIYHQLLKRVDLVYDLIVKMKWPQTVRELAMRRAMQKPKQKKQKHTTVRIRWWSPTQLLTHRRVA